MKDIASLRLRLLLAMGFAVVPVACTNAPAGGGGTADTAGSETAQDVAATDTTTADTTPADTATADAADVADTTVADTAKADVPPTEVAVETVAEVAAEVVAPDTGPDATGDTAYDGSAPTCQFGKAAQTCYTAAALKANIESPPMGGKPGDPYTGPLPPEGCPEPKIVQDGCCNPGQGEALLKGNECCYWHCTGACCGRPLEVDGVQLVAALIDGDAWVAAGAPLPLDDAAALAAVWRKDAQDEHASIASFFRFGLELLQLAAPPQLVAAASRAAGDEVRHAELCLGIAAQLDGRPQSPGPLACENVVARQDWPTIAAACVREGCVGETIAATQAGSAAKAATTPAIAAALQEIADDEARHAELAWQFVAWSWRTGGPSVQAAIAEAFAAIARVPLAVDPREALLAGVADSARRAGGRLAAGAAARLARQVLKEVVGPCAARLMAAEFAHHSISPTD